MPLIGREAFPARVMAVGTHDIPERVLPDNARGFYFELSRNTAADRSIWNNSSVVQVELEGSFDGVKWFPAGGFSAVGGVHIRTDGTEAPVSAIFIPLPPGIGRRIKSRITVSGGSLLSQIAQESHDTLRRR